MLIDGLIKRLHESKETIPEKNYVYVFVVKLIKSRICSFSWKKDLP